MKNRILAHQTMGLSIQKVRVQDTPVSCVLGSGPGFRSLHDVHQAWDKDSYPKPFQKTS
jgi:hypothetical protein